MRQARTTVNTQENREESTVSNDTAGTRSSRRGFGAVNKATLTTFRVGDSSEVIAFLEPENFTYALRHWVKYQDPADPKNTITQVEFCLEDDCPLCDIGDRAKATAYFNVVDLSIPNKVLVWEATADPTGAIQKEYNKLAKRGQSLSDDNLYWVVSRELGKNGFYSYSVDKLTADELAAEWPSLVPLAPAQREALRARANDESYIVYKTREELQEFVDSL